MATLTAIGFTAAAGICGFAVSMASFGVAKSIQSEFIAARCVGRPRTVIYNSNPSHACQDRGNMFWGWVPWVMKLTYANMLGGVPGTGTRDGGLSGLMLKVNLDGIVLIRFHHLCFRVSSLAVLLYILIVLPVFKTAQCSIVSGDFDSPRCLEQNFTGYQRFTIENVADNIFEEELNATGYHRLFTGYFLARLYTVVFVSWIITCYTCALLEKEWRDILAMRRVYYLEADHWGDRNAELHETLLREERENINGSMNDIESARNYAKIRDPWVHHPEQRDTVPNVQLYSVLVGGLPGLPTEAFLQEDIKAVFSRKQSIDWQLAVTSAFFDHCVPNQPGFSSSVAAVTVLPAASQITEAWKHWYNTAAKVRKLRFIRREIAKRNKNDKRRNKRDVTFGNESFDQQSNKSFYGKLKRKHKKKKKKRNSVTRPSVYAESDEKKKYYSEVLGNTNDLDVEKNLLHALKLGPEQTAVYSREFAQGAANIAPYGWNEYKVRNASLAELLKMEKVAANAVQEASHALRKAQEKIAEDDQNENLYNDKDLTDLMVSATTAGRNDYAVNDSQESDEVENINQITTEKDSFKKSTFRERRLNIWTKMSSVTGDIGVDNTSTNQRHSGLRTTRRSLLRNLEVITPTVDLSNCGSGHAIENNTQDERTTLGENTQSWNRNSLMSLDDIGLEAGLFLEQKNLSSGHSQHLPRASLKRSRSVDDISLSYKDDSDEISLSSLEIDKEHNLQSSFRRSKSSDDIDILQRQHKIPVLSDFGMEEAGMDSSSSKNERFYDAIGAPPFTIPNNGENEEVECESLQHQLPESNDGGDETGKSAPPRTKSIWDMIASENIRRSQIRKRLSSISKSNEEDKVKEAKNMAFTETKFPIAIREKSNNNSALTGVSIPNSDNISYKHVTDPRIFSIDESSNKSFKIFESDTFSTRKGNESVHNLDCSERDLRFSETDRNVRLSFDFEEKAGLRKRQAANTRVNRPNKTVDEKWLKVIQIARESSSRRNKNDRVDPIESGSYSLCTFLSLWDRMMKILKNAFHPSKWRNRSNDIVDPLDLAGESTFAVVTFTSRQAAVAARHCLADSRGTNRWNTVSEIPSPPLADAPVFNLSSFRGFVRPVTISINDRQKMIRHILALAILGAIYIFYIIPLTAVQELLSPQSLQEILPDLDSWLQNGFMKYVFSGFIPALVWTGFYAICPPMFKAIANFGSNATSAACAEGSALRYFWWFMIVSAFTGTSLASAVIKGGGLDLGSSFQSVIIEAASKIPSTISATWLNWIIVRVTLVLPTQYILQMNAYLFSWFRLKALARAVQGGGSGGPIPYRLYVDSGVVMLCLLALAPASPLIAIAAFVYFLFCVPMLRWVLVFLYKPKFDIGGARFPFIFDMCVSGMIAGQILLGAMLFIRRAFGPAFMALFPLLPTIFYRWVLLKRYLKAFTDVALLQTSLLDGWDTNEESSTSKREEFRQFLVDCHKAAYVPVCIASEEATVITSEPAVVMPLEMDADEDDDDVTSVHSESQSIGGGDIELVHRTNRTSEHQTLYHPYEPQKQHGRMMRRASFGPSNNYIPSSPFDAVNSPRKKKLYVAKPLI